MRAIILVGGNGSRLRPLTESVPKQLIPVAGKPMIQHVLDRLPAAVDDIVLAGGPGVERIAARARGGWNRRVRCVVEETPLGTGGGVRNAAAKVDGPFVVANSDVLTTLSVLEMIDTHRSTPGAGTIALVRVQDTRQYGVARLDEASGRVTAFVEKPQEGTEASKWVNAGYYVLDPEVVGMVAPDRPVSLEREVFPALVERGLFAHRFSGYWDDAGTPERLLRSQRHMFDNGRGLNSGSPVGARCRGPVSVSGYVTARGSTVGPYVTLGSGVVLGSGSRVEDSVLMDGVEVGAAASVVGCVLGPRSRVRAGHSIRGVVLGSGAEA